MKTLGNTGGLGIPKLRGIVHLVMSPLSLVVGIVLITLASELSGRITLGVFTITAVTLSPAARSIIALVGARSTKQCGDGLIMQIFLF